MKKTIAIEVYGKVQGVWFRASTKSKAEELGIVGTVQNRLDGSVYIEALGPVETLDVFQAWCKIGPEFARVDRIVPISMEDKKFDCFSIIR